jgi:hypothetical protein
MQETNEAKSAVTARFRKAEADDALDSSSRTRASGLGVLSSATGSPATSEMQASLINAITRTMSASLTSATLSITAGVERRTRWTKAGLELDNEAQAEEGHQSLDIVSKPRPKLQPATVADLFCMDKADVKKLGRSLYVPLDRALKLSLLDAGLSVFLSLKPGSWVAVMSHGKLRFGTGQCSACEQ